MKILGTVLAVSIAGALATTANAANVKITPLGSHSGEFCPLDRAMILEDPDGTRILYDAGRTVAGADDPRLGSIDVVLVANMPVHVPLSGWTMVFNASGHCIAGCE